MLLLDPDDVLGATRRLGATRADVERLLEVRRHADDTPGCEVMQQSSGPWIRATRHADWVHTQLDADFARIGEEGGAAGLKGSVGLVTVAVSLAATKTGV